MKKLLIALFASLLASSALAQTVNGPIPNAGAYGAYNSSPPTCLNGSGCWFQTDVNGNLKVAVSSGGGGGSVTQGTSPWVISGQANVTLTDCSGSITLGGTAQNAFAAAATRRGFTIANIDTSEPLWISFTTTAAASGTGSYPLGPADTTTFSNLSSFTSPLGMGINTALSVVAATTAHKFTCTVW